MNLDVDDWKLKSKPDVYYPVVIHTQVPEVCHDLYLNATNLLYAMIERLSVLTFIT